MGWVCQICGKKYDAPKGKKGPLCYEKPGCKAKGEYACVWKDEEKTEWKWESGDLSSAPKGAEDDLATLVGKGGNYYSASIGTIVGGNAIKSGKKVDGLTHDSARIDTQNPPKKGTYNVQFQVGKASLACVIFTGEDKEGTVKAMLKKSLKDRKKGISPSAQAL